MHATTKPASVGSSAVSLAIDLAKDVFELAFADASGRIVERKRLKREPFARCLENRPPLRIVMEACGSAHAWARRFARLGHEVTLLPAQHLHPYETACSRVVQRCFAVRARLQSANPSRLRSRRSRNSAMMRRYRSSPR